MSDADSDNRQQPQAVILDFLAHGRTDEGGPQYDRSPLAYAIGYDEFRLYEVVFTDDVDVSIGDEITIGRQQQDIDQFREIEYSDLSSGAQAELDYVIEEIVEGNEQRFVGFYNDAQPITLRLHQLNLLPGIGKKLRNGILDERKRKPFESFDELEERISGLHDPEQVIVDRIIEELREDDLKYRLFARREE